jgi:hypothetical protein
MTGRSHPDNDVGIMKCSTCGHLPNAHAVAEAENHKQHGNDAFEWAQYDVALQRYSQGVERAPHDAKLRSNRAAVYMQLKQYQQVSAFAPPHRRSSTPTAMIHLGCRTRGFCALRVFVQRESAMLVG